MNEVLALREELAQIALTKEVMFGCLTVLAIESVFLFIKLNKLINYAFTKAKS